MPPHPGTPSWSILGILGGLTLLLLAHMEEMHSSFSRAVHTVALASSVDLHAKHPPAWLSSPATIPAAPHNPGLKPKRLIQNSLAQALYHLIFHLLSLDCVCSLLFTLTHSAYL